MFMFAPATRLLRSALRLNAMRTNVLGLLASLLVPLALLACGFQPVHATRLEGGAAETLAQVEVMPVPGRVGQLFVAALEDKLNPQSVAATKRYELTPVVNVQLVPLSIAPDGTVARFRVLYDTSYTLYDREAGKQIQTDRVQRSGSYEVRNEADYSTYVAEQDAVARGLDELSQDYFLRLAAFLKRYQSGQEQDA